MGDRIVLVMRKTDKWKTVDGEERERSSCSPALYSHWGGYYLLDQAKAFWDYCQEHHLRDDPENMMFNFACWICKEPEDGEYFLSPTVEEAGAPDDNGYWEMDTKTGRIFMTAHGDWDGDEYDIGDEY